jgi:hypothetical protein
MISSAKNVFHTNFLEYRLTGDKKYKTVADSALSSIKKAIADLETTVKATGEVPSDFSHSIRESSMRLKNGRKRLIEQKDILEGANMRNSVPAPTVSSIDWRYYVTVILLIVALVAKA